VKLLEPILLPSRVPLASDSSLDLFQPSKIGKKARKKHQVDKSKRPASSSSDEVFIVSVKPINGKMTSKSAAQEPSQDTSGSSESESQNENSKTKAAYSSPVVVPTTYDTTTPVGQILSLIYGSVNHDINMSAARFFSTPEKLTYKKISFALYLLYKIKSPVEAMTDPSFSNAIVQYYAGKVVAKLDPSWRNTELYKQLVEIEKEQSEFSAQQKKDHYWPEVAKFEIVRRASGKKMLKHISGRQSINTNGSSTPTQTPGTGKSVKKTVPPHFQPGRRSGKEAGLRLASTPAKRDSEAMSSSVTPEAEDFTTRASKKRRRAVTPPEMGLDSDEEAALNTLPLRLRNLDATGLNSNQAAAEDDMDDETEEAEEGLTLVSQPINEEGCFVRGRMGSWVCTYCDFPVWDPETDDGLATARQHMRDEAARLMREALITEEAMKARLPSSHLLDLIREKGREARLKEEENRMVNGKLAPEPIRRVRA
jgi:hypothetical protein